jgi:hypothetical protein
VIRLATLKKPTRLVDDLYDSSTRAINLDCYNTVPLGLFGLVLD